MKPPIIAGGIVAALTFLNGCTTSTSQPVKAQAASATLEPPACTRGAIDSQRSFILCAAGKYTELDAALAMMKPPQPDLDIASIASEFGRSTQSISGIEAATYAKIVGKTAEQKSRTLENGVKTILIEGRKFRKVSLAAENKRPVILFIEE